MQSMYNTTFFYVAGHPTLMQYMYNTTCFYVVGHPTLMQSMYNTTFPRCCWAIHHTSMLSTTCFQINKVRSTPLFRCAFFLHMHHRTPTISNHAAHMYAFIPTFSHIKQLPLHSCFWMGGFAVCVCVFATQMFFYVAGHPTLMKSM